MGQKHAENKVLTHLQQCYLEWINEMVYNGIGKCWWE